MSGLEGSSFALPCRTTKELCSLHIFITGLVDMGALVVEYTKVCPVARTEPEGLYSKDKRPQKGRLLQFQHDLCRVWVSAGVGGEVVPRDEDGMQGDGGKDTAVAWSGLLVERQGRGRWRWWLLGVEMNEARSW